MAKRKQRASARKKKTTAKRVTARTRGKPARKAARRATARTRAKKAAKRAAMKTKTKRQAIKARVMRAAAKKAVPQPTEPLRQLTEPRDESVVVDLIEEPVPGVLVVTEFESVRFETPIPDLGAGESSGPAERQEEED